MTIYYVALGIGILAGIGGQILLKAGADAPDFVSQLLRPSTIAGLALYGSAAFLYIVALRKIPVSVAFPSVSLSYAIVAVLGHFLFGATAHILRFGAGIKQILLKRVYLFLQSGLRIRFGSLLCLIRCILVCAIAGVDRHFIFVFCHNPIVSVSRAIVR